MGKFLTQRKWRIRTQKMRGEISQGLIMPLTILPKDTEIEENKDVAELLGVKSTKQHNQGQTAKLCQEIIALILHNKNQREFI